MDKSIKTIYIENLQVGENIIELCIPYTINSCVERIYLLGDFDVKVNGDTARIIAPRKVHYGDWTTQGLPFYAGNLTYNISFEIERDGVYVLELPRFSAPLVGVRLDNADCGLIAFAPHRLTLPVMTQGRHVLSLKIYGNRYNSFGQLHNADPELDWFGPLSWHTKGQEWSYEYRLKPMGLLTAPRLYPEDKAAAPRVAPSYHAKADVH